ncbi:hypothetical protein Tsubulata_041248 [Turnera subulata]|uniref:F-box domain-containing protein n=1 Tax=Turnera subulata TaxID=218843 RepID=A0A9Q0J3L4_9ROSI|nr:hypothetical protein Tsubulata_041248 [Turnera subulata]
MADSRNMLSSKKQKICLPSRSSQKQKRDEDSDDTEMKHNKTRAQDNTLLVDQAKSTNAERLVISGAPNLGYFPRDILEEILDLLPKKSIERFRSVSKSLFSLLGIKFNIPKLLYYPCKTNFLPPNYGINSSDDRGLFIGVVLSDYRGDAKNKGYMVPELLKNYMAPERSGPLRFYFSIGSCSGLVCMEASYHYRNWETIVWNPFTGVCRKLPHRKHYAFAFGYGFGYDSSSDDYKVFAVTVLGSPTGDGEDEKIVQLFSLKTGGSWRILKNTDRDQYLQYIQWCRGMGLFVNGALHWRPQDSHWGEKSKITAFDLGKEKFCSVPSPPNLISPGCGESYSLGVVGDYLCFLHSHSYTNTIWVMKEYGNEASWVPFISYTGNHLEYVCDFVPRSFKDGRYMMLQFGDESIDVLKWNNNLQESDEAKKYSKKIKSYRVTGYYCLPYTQTLTSPYASYKA